MSSRARLTGLLARHLLHKMRRQRARAAVLWAAIAVVAVAIGTLAAALPTWLTARAPLADALSYE